MTKLKKTAQAWGQSIPPTHSTVWNFQDRLSFRLFIWAVANIVMGVWLQQRRSKFLRGVGMQSLSWGAINALIAAGGSGAAHWRKNRMKNPYARSIRKREERNLFRALWINGILDVFYIIGGLTLAYTRGRHSRLMRGSGWGIVIQGAFLLVFDAIHALVIATNHEE